MFKKISLREFQANLAARLAKTHQESPSGLLGFAVGQEYWLTKLSDSGEVVPLTPIAPVPLTKNWFCGLANIRGNLYAVTDFSAFQGKEATPSCADASLLLIGERFHTNAALLVSRVLGLRNRDKLSVVERDKYAPAWIEEVYTDEEGLQWKALNVPELLADKRFTDIEA